MRELRHIAERGGLVGILNVGHHEHDAVFVVGGQIEHADITGRRDHHAVKIVLKAVDFIQRKVIEFAILERSKPVELLGLFEILFCLVCRDQGFAKRQICVRHFTHLFSDMPDAFIVYGHIFEPDKQTLTERMLDSGVRAGIGSAHGGQEQQLERALVDAPALLVFIR